MSLPRFRHAVLVAVAGLTTLTAGAGLFQEGSGTAKVKVVDGNKAPLVGLKVQIFRSPRQAGNAPGSPGAGSGAIAPEASFGSPGPVNLMQMGTPVASKETDKEGLVEFSNLKAGRYAARASSPSAGRGNKAFTIEAGKTVQVDLDVKK